MLKVARILLGVLLISGVVIIAGCGSDDDTTSSGGTGTYIHIPFPEGTYFARVRSIEVTATGSGITTPITAKDTTIVGTTQTEISLPVPAGTARHFDIIASDSLGRNLYRAQMDATVGSGRTDLSALLYPVGYGTPTKVKVFRDVVNWGYGVDSVLTYAGFTPGSGTNRYQVLGSSLMGSITLNPGTDFVIIDANQDSTFYANYMAARSQFEDFVDQGGSMLYMVGFYTSLAPKVSLLMPDSVSVTMDTSRINYALLCDHPISSGMDSVMNYNYSSHCYLSNLPSGALTLYIDSHDHATFSIYKHGKGIIATSGQTMVWYRQFSGPMQPMLSQTIRFMLGLDPTPEPHPRTGIQDAPKSSAERP